MTHGAGPHEEAEHAQHHSQDPFDRRVAMTMVIVAALLAAIRVAAHRAHNDTLRYQIQANVHHTQESDQWNFFQAKKGRQHLYESQSELLQALKLMNKTQAEQIKNLVANIKKAAAEEEEEEELAAAEKKPDAANGKPAGKEKKRKKGGKKGSVEEYVRDWADQAAGYKAESAEIQEAAKKQKELAEKDQQASEHWHHRSNYFDMGELGVELALVLCSVAILSKRPGYWYGGMILGVIGVVVALLGFVAH